MTQLTTILADLHELLASPPHGIKLRTIGDILTDLRTFVEDEPDVYDQDDYEYL